MGPVDFGQVHVVLQLGVCLQLLLRDGGGTLFERARAWAAELPDGGAAAKVR